MNSCGASDGSSRRRSLLHGASGEGGLLQVGHDSTPLHSHLCRSCRSNATSPNNQSVLITSNSVARCNFAPLAKLVFNQHLSLLEPKRDELLSKMRQNERERGNKPSPVVIVGVIRVICASIFYLASHSKRPYLVPTGSAQLTQWKTHPGIFPASAFLFFLRFASSYELISPS